MNASKPIKTGTRQTTSMASQSKDDHSGLIQSLFWMILILLLATALRATHLEFQSLAQGELGSWRFSALRTYSQIWADPPGTEWPPLYFIVLRAWILRAGDSEFALRYPSVLGGVIAVAGMYRLALALFNRRSAFVTAALTAVLAWPIEYSQTVRPYSWMMFLGALMTVFWLHILRRAGRKQRPSVMVMIGYILAALVYLYTHHYAILVLGMHGLFALVVLVYHLAQRSLSPGVVRHFIFVVGAIFILIAMGYLPWLGRLLEIAGEPNQWMSPPDSLFGYMWTYITYVVNRDNVLAWLTLLGAAVGLRTSMVALGPDRDIATRIWPGMLAVSLLTIPFLVAYGYSIWISPAISLRYLTSFIPVGLYLLAGAAFSDPRVPRMLYASLVAIVVLGLVGHLVLDRKFYTRYTFVQYREVAAVLNSYEGQDDTVLWTSSQGKILFRYYADDLKSLPDMELIIWNEDQIPELEALLARRNPETLWYIWAHRIPSDALLDYFDEHFTVTERYAWYGSGIWIMDVPDSPKNQGD